MALLDPRVAAAPRALDWAGPQRWLWWLVPLLLALALLHAQRTESVALYAIDEFQASRCVPGTGSGWEPVALPFRKAGDCWLLRVELERSGIEVHGAGLLLVGLHQDGAVFVNGVQVRNLPATLQHSHHPRSLSLAIGSGLLQPGRNELMLELRSSTRPSAAVILRAAFLGPQALLERRQQWHHALQTGGAQLTLVMMLAAFLLVLTVGWNRPQDRRYPWFGLSLVSAAVYLWQYASATHPLGQALWNILMHSALALALYALIRLSALMLQQPKPRFRGQVVLLALLSLVLSRSEMFSGSINFGLDWLFRVLLLGLVVSLVVTWWRGRHVALRPNARWFSAGAVLLTLLGIHDSLHVQLRHEWATSGYAMHFALLYLVLLLCAALLLELLDKSRMAPPAAPAQRGPKPPEPALESTRRAPT